MSEDLSRDPDGGAATARDAPGGSGRGRATQAVDGDDFFATLGYEAADPWLQTALWSDVMHSRSSAADRR